MGMDTQQVGSPHLLPAVRGIMTPLAPSVATEPPSEGTAGADSRE